MPILIIGGLLTLFGILAVYSVSIHESFLLTLGMVNKGTLADPSNYFYFLRQLRNLGIAIVLCFFVYKIPLRFFRTGGVLIFLVTAIIQLLVFTPLGVELNGARGWLVLPGFGTIQPSELFKLGCIIFLAGWFVKKQGNLSEIKGFIGFLVMLGLCSFVFLLIPDLGTVLVLGLSCLILYRYAGGKARFVMMLLGIGIFLGLTVGMQFSYIKKRLEFFINPEVDAGGRGIGWQTKQALIGVGIGSRFGQGYGKGLQKFGFIPEAQSDFIFAAFSEEVGFFGNMILLGLFLALAYVVAKKMHEVKDEYYQYLVAGIMALIIVQVFVNIGVNVKILPLTGLTLPFISFGGTALMINLIELVILYKILYGNESIQGMVKRK